MGGIEMGVTASLVLSAVGAVLTIAAGEEARRFLR
jgi:hypothetical protein